ncbi:MAG: FlgD immunoglobulin-like domain containing protein [bacterium]
MFKNFGRVSAVAAAFILLLVAGRASAQIVIDPNETTIPFGLQCNEIWTDAGLDLKFVPTNASDACPGICVFEPIPNAVSMLGRLVVDLTDVPGLILSVAVDVEPFCAPGCTRAFVYENGVVIDSTANATSPNYQTLTVQAGPNLVDEFVVSGCETFVHEIRITVATANGVEDVAWPARLDVGAPAPNPFSRETSVALSLREAGRVRLTVYDVRGTRVRATTKQLAAGIHSLTWDGRTDAGIRAPGGVYFCDVSTGAETARRKVVLVR